MIYLVNTFSLNMLPTSLYEGEIQFRRLSSDDMVTRFRDYAEGLTIRNAIGHPDTDRVVRAVLKELGFGLLSPGKRETVTILPGDMFLVAQYIGPRLQEGATELPEGARVEFLSVWLS